MLRSLTTETLHLCQEPPPAELDKLDHAASILRRGGLVAFPTETVYGLGANGLDPRACQAIFTAKGRPSDNPLILHVAEIAQARDLAASFNNAAHVLAQNFWPGPLTLVVKRTAKVPHIAAGGLDTVGLRFPLATIAQELIRRAGVPIAAPSANTSGRPSPTCARHVAQDLFGKIDLIIDGGTTTLGLESTIVDVCGHTPRLLRPGSITLEQLENALGKIDVDPAVTTRHQTSTRPQAPGMAYAHYSPKAKLTLVTGQISRLQQTLNTLVQELHQQGIPYHNIAILTTDEGHDSYTNTQAKIFTLGRRSNPQEIAANLYNTLRALDDAGITHAYAETIGETGLGLSVMNRLRKAAHFREYLC